MPGGMWPIGEEDPKSGLQHDPKKYPRNPGLKTTLQEKFNTHVERTDCMVKTVPTEKPTPRRSHKVSGCHTKWATILDSAGKMNAWLKTDRNCTVTTLLATLLRS